MAEAQRVYLHGQPGSPAELRLAGVEPSPGLFAPDRNGFNPALAEDAALDRLAEDVARRFPQGAIRLIGFSLGAYVAVELALRLADRGRAADLSLDLVSAAGPLALGDFLPDMAGGAVFRLARTSPPAFAALTAVQRRLAALAPGLLQRQLFATAAGADADLARDRAFQGLLREILAASLGPVYRREVRAYARWPAERLAALTAPVALWHGEADTWAPLAMAQAVADARPASRSLTVLPGLSHYSTLKTVAPRLGL